MKWTVTIRNVVGSQEQWQESTPTPHIRTSWSLEYVVGVATASLDEFVFTTRCEPLVKFRHWEQMTLQPLTGATTRQTSHWLALIQISFARFSNFEQQLDNFLGHVSCFGVNPGLRSERNRDLWTIWPTDTSPLRRRNDSGCCLTADTAIQNRHSIVLILTHTPFAIHKPTIN